MATKLIENLRGRVPYIARLQRRIDELEHKLAATTANPELRSVHGTHDRKTVAQFRSFLRLLEPHRAANVEKRRFGRDADGGYVMLNDLGGARTAISLGIGDEVSWDLDIAGRGLRVIQFDHTVEGPPRNHPSFVFTRARIVGRHERPGDVTLSEILARQELAEQKAIVAKIDIEGAEWDVLARTDGTSLGRISQMIVEFHGLRRFAEPAWRANALEGLTRLMSTHVCVHVHGNNWAPFTVVGGIAFPDGFEATFARRADHAFAPSGEVFPTELDRPCNPKLPDLFLGAWDY
jgi:Methyltransferase FkbM domain